MFGRRHNLCFMSEPTVNKLILKYCDTCSSSCNGYACLKSEALKWLRGWAYPSLTKRKPCILSSSSKRAYVFHGICASKREMKSSFIRK